MTSQALAELLRVTRVEISRWENDKVRIGDLSDLRLRQLAIEHLLPIEHHRITKAELYRIMKTVYPTPEHGDVNLNTLTTASTVSLGVHDELTYA
jgi:transcriptional regulator with XRE-family HTH domain